MTKAITKEKEKGLDMIGRKVDDQMELISQFYPQIYYQLAQEQG